VLTLPSTDGVALAVHDLGGSGPPLVLSHATGFHGLVYAPLACHLTDRFHCWSFDFRGHGASTRPVTDDVAWTGYGRDASAIVHELGVGGGVGFGHSMGAAALLMAEQAAPGSFAGLVLFEPIVHPPVMPDGVEPRPDIANRARRRRFVFTSRDEAYANFASKPPLDALAPEALQAYVDHGLLDTADGRVRLACEPEYEARTYEGSFRHGTFDGLDKIGCPVLVLAGRSEGNLPAAVAPIVAEMLPHGRVRVLPHLGHFGPLQDPAAIAAIIREFADTALPE
jgi:pimeloyl-ACP methyl ester carboxylesterase